MISRAVPQDNPIAALIRQELPFLDMENGPWVAGGAARRLANNDTEIENSDIDIFFQSEEMFDWASSFIACKTSHYNKIKTTNQKVTPTSTLFTVQLGDQYYEIQLSKKRFYTNVEELFDDFDFTICMFATDGKLLLGIEKGFEDLAKRRLILHRKPNKPKAARLAKYCYQGFAPSPGVISDMFAIDQDWNFVKFLTQDEY